MAPARAAASRLMSSLPEEIQVEILLKLPAKSLLTCKCVCKPWHNLITSPRFINDHLHLSIQNKSNYKLMYTDMESDYSKPVINFLLKKPLTYSFKKKPLIYSVDFASILSSPGPYLSCEYICKEAVLMDTPFEYKEGMEIRVLGTCHGLICFGIFVDKETSICIWNPTTREYKEIRQSGFQMKPWENILIAGFGYDNKTGDYKMVRIADYEKNAEFGYEMTDYCKVEVYTFGSHSSKTIHTFPNMFSIHVVFRGVFLNGALHWISNNTCKCNYVISFDVSNEKFNYMPLPEKSAIHTEGRNKYMSKTVGVFGGCLSLVLLQRDLAEVWVMQDYGVRDSWTKLFTTTQETITQNGCYCMPVLSLKNGEILMYTPDGFVLCDPKNERIGKVSSFFQNKSHKGRVMREAHPESYVESLVSLDSGTYVKKPRGQKSR